jgi:hypothetical protein
MLESIYKRPARGGKINYTIANRNVAMPRPSPTEYAPYFEKYLALVSESDIGPALEKQLAETVPFFRAIPESQAGVLHAPYTWTIKEVLGHLVDAERIFVYLALRFARGDKTPLPAFDENAYVPAAEFNRRTLSSLVDEYEAARRSHACFFSGLSEAAWLRVGEANGTNMSVRAIAFTLVGHVRHHMAIVKKRLAK